MIDHNDVIKLGNYLISATRERVADEIIPVSVEHSATKYDNEASNGAGNAIDLDLGTRSYTVPRSEGNAWLRVTLDKVYCVQQVIRHYGTQFNTLTCTDSDCSKCEGDWCNKLILTVSTEGAISDLAPVSDCKYGDTVKLERIDRSSFKVYEIVIIGKPGNRRVQIKSKLTVVHPRFSQSTMKSG